MARDRSDDPSGINQSEGPAAAGLAAQVMQAEQDRDTAQKNADGFVLPDDLLPGVGAESVSLRTATREGGLAIIVVLTLLQFVEAFDRVTISVLGPDIQETLGISDTLLAGLASVGGITLVLATMPFAWLGDRVSRTRVLGGAAFVWSGFVALTAVVANPFQLGVARAGAGLGGSANIPISPSLVADAYPVGARTRLMAVESLGGQLGAVVGPFAVGGLALWFGGQTGWRGALLVVAVTPLVLGAILFLLRDPGRGRYEQLAVLGEQLDIENPPVRLSAAFARLKKVRTFYFFITGIGVVGFALVAVPTLMGLLLRDVYGYGAFTRGWIISITSAVSIPAVIIAAHVGDRIFRRDPPQVMRLCALGMVLYGILLSIGLQWEEPVVLVGMWALANACIGAAFTAVRPSIAAVVPYSMRSQAYAMVGVYVFLMGGFFGGLLGGAFSDAWGQRVALTIIIIPATLLGGFMIAYGSRYMKSDISLTVADLLDEQEERRRMEADPESIPVLQVRSLDVSYGPLQVLFDVNLEVQRGETLALLGTNGAGKSTLLRAVAGHVMPDRGVVRLNGRTITLVAPELRSGMGMVLVPGGEALFTSMTVRDNLDLWARRIEDSSERDRALERVYRVFPAVRSLLDQRAGSLSGGEQQMVALSRALMLKPDILLIDELSLGLAPLVVQELLEVIEALKADGVTMVIVEQSVNVALTVADRAVFMERGQVRFEGPANELLTRGDLLRSVFLSGQGA